MSSQETQKILFAEVLLTRPIPLFYTYKIPAQFTHISKGARVLVPFGKNKIITGIVHQTLETSPDVYEIKEILEVSDEGSPCINEIQFKLIHWISEYYIANKGDVLQVMLPSGLRVSSETRMEINPLWENTEELSDEETKILENITERKTLSFEEVGHLLELKNPTRFIKSLYQRGAITYFEEVKEKFTPKTEKIVFLDTFYEDETQLKLLFAELEKKPKQLEILLAYLQHIPIDKLRIENQNGVSKQKVFQEIDKSSAFKSLLEKKVFIEKKQVISRFQFPKALKELPQLSEKQQLAKDEITSFFNENKPVLLHGITGSGKTEIYIRLIDEAIQNGTQVLFLVPEIALSTQMVERLLKYFGNKLGVYHSKYSDNERVEVWNGIKDGHFQIILGVRSSIFLPFDNLGLIIIDEEHDGSFKQQDRAPRYNTRDSALVLAQFHQAQVLMGSATPALETYYHAQQGKYGLVKLLERYSKVEMPDIDFLNVRVLELEKKMKGHFPAPLLEKLQTLLLNKKQVIFLQNRRGYSSYIQCQSCGWVPECQKCDVNLTFHSYNQSLVCHYCGHNERHPRNCPACGAQNFKTIGFGTEKLEDEIKLFFPDVRTLRMDQDTTKTKFALKTIIEQFANQDADILIGTQMVAKGLDFDNVSLVAVFDCDRLLHYPDFRAHERVFQLLTQVSGRAGRKNEKGEVLILTSNPKHKVLQMVKNYDYLGFYEAEIIEREIHAYPPFTRNIDIRAKSDNQGALNKFMSLFSNMLIEKIGSSRVLGPQSPVVSKINNEYLLDLHIKIEKNKLDMKKVKLFLAEIKSSLLADKAFSKVKCMIDVDPL